MSNTRQGASGKGQGGRGKGAATQGTVLPAGLLLVGRALFVDVRLEPFAGAVLPVRLGPDPGLCWVYGQEGSAICLARRCPTLAKLLTKPNCAAAEMVRRAIMNQERMGA